MGTNGNIAELVQLIFEAETQPPIAGIAVCSSDADAPEGRVPLAVLARICKAFHEPALDLLWRYPESLVPLFLCMPPHVWRFDKWNPPIWRQPFFDDIKMAGTY
ncbi:hypothetical protein DFH09DRAFT_1343654 [Mycena vulgaris]|nr:hypothetical protein DFH09DRAFT_1343654 [Mycena vulgaris]